MRRDRNAKKRLERAMVEAWLTSQRLPLACLTDGDRERPDALIRLEDEIIGVEVTTVVEASPPGPIHPQQWTVEAKRIAPRVQEAFEAIRQDALVVRLELHRNWRPGAVDAAALARELALAVARVLDGPRPFERPGDPILERDPHPALARLYIARTRYESHWDALFAGSVLPATAADIAATVAKKEVELEAYQQAAPKVWLLIDCSLSGQGRTLDVPQPFPLATGFDRVLCCGWGRWQWVEIPTTRPHGQ